MLDRNILMSGVLWIAQYTLILTESGDSDASADTQVQYRTPIVYEKEDWALADAGWVGDPECLEYLRFP